MARTLFDANVFISYLLRPARGGTIGTLLDAAFAGVFTLLVADSLLEEFTRRVMTKPYLAQHISRHDLDVFAAALLAIAERIPTITSPIPAVVRDPKDDYLLAYALVGRADYLVTGDRDLLDLPPLAGLMIVTPAAFAAALGLGGAAGTA